jgi:hypothetical protein
MHTAPYTLTVITPGAYALWARKDGHFWTPTRAVTLPPSQAGVDLTFFERHTISGTVRDYDRTPVADVWGRHRSWTGVRFSTHLRHGRLENR